MSTPVHRFVKTVPSMEDVNRELGVGCEGLCYAYNVPENLTVLSFTIYLKNSRSLRVEKDSTKLTNPSTCWRWVKSMGGFTMSCLL